MPNPQAAQRRNEIKLAPTDASILKKYKCQLGKELGVGAFGKVKIGQLTEGNSSRRIAIKIMDLSKISESYSKKFLPREMAIWPKLRHCNIIQVYRYITTENRIYALMELAEKGDVADYIHEHGPAPEFLAKRWIRNLVQALVYCHRQGIAHRDIKCENLLLDGKLNVKLTDFGFCRSCIEEEKHRRILSSTYCGSAAYAAPELLQGVPYNPLRSDIWSLGVCLYVMVTNELPFEEADLGKMRRQEISRSWTLSNEILFSRSGREFLRKVLEPDVLKRPTVCCLAQNPWLKTNAKEVFLLHEYSKD